MPRTEPPDCPVCLGPGTAFIEAEGRSYFRCPRCVATYLDPAQRPDAVAERAHYDHHENHVDDPGYRAFLSRVADPLLSVLGAGARGLDYGCGPGPALAAMLTEAGHSMAVWDPFYAPDPAPLSHRYDFVTCTEVAEHFHNPARAFAKMRGLLRPGGWLALMTCFQTDDAAFANWHYRRDPTHVVFYRRETMAWLAKRHGMTFESPRKDVVLMQVRG